LKITWNSTKLFHLQKPRQMAKQKSISKKTEKGTKKEEVQSTSKNKTISIISDVVIDNTAEGKDSKEAKDEQLRFDDEIMKTPFIYNEAYQDLPKIFKDITELFNSRERDLVFISSIIILSGTIPSVKGIYDGRTVYSNLNGFIVAPPAAGKGVMVFAKSIAQKVHESRLSAFEKEAANYNTERKKRKDLKKSNNDETESSFHSLSYPKRTLLYIPGNSSAASVIDHLKDNDGNGIICETEADTLVNTFKQEWGGYSDVIRKAFHHEAVSLSRKKDKEYAEISCPKLSLLLSSTPDQVVSLIQDSGNGLFSRFLFYAFNTPPVWRDVFAKNELHLESKFETIGDNVLAICKYVALFNVEFKLTKIQQNLLNDTLSDAYNKYVKITAGDSASFVKRFGLIWFRIAMILTVFRKVEGNTVVDLNDVECTNTDFYIAWSIVMPCLRHNLLMYEYLKDTNAHKKGFLRTSSLGIHRFYEKIEKNVVYDRNSLVKLGSSINLSASSIDKYLRKLSRENLLDQPSNGRYQKI
jgi:hypothetical protein